MGDDVAVLAGDLSQATVRLNRVLRSKQQSSVSLPQISALAGLAFYGPMSPGALAHHERVKPPSMTRVLGLLDDAGLIERSKHPTDGRQAIVAISRAGAALLVAEGATREKWLRGKLEQLSAEQRDTLRAAVRIMTDIAKD